MLLTIGQLASFAGVTVRTVRHYHAEGLLPEPNRDQSGYRRYDAHAVVRLIKIRTLAEAGVPLGSIDALLNAGEAEFNAAITEIDERLEAEIRQRQQHRERIAQLAAGESLVLPAEVVDYLDDLRKLGVDERVVELEREGWILVTANSSELIGGFMADKREQLRDPDFLAFYRSVGELLDGPVDDALLEQIADHLVAFIERAARERGDAYVEDDVTPGSVGDLLDALLYDATPAARRLTALLEQRGWTGWSRLRRVQPG